MVFILYFQQATHVRLRPSLIVFDTRVSYTYTSGLDVLPIFLCIAASFLYPSFVRFVFLFTPLPLIYYDSSSHCCDHLLENGETNRTEYCFPIILLDGMMLL